jgi:hypothetical protein
MRWVGLSISSLLLAIIMALPACAVSTQSSDQAIVKTNSPFIITNYASTASRLDFVQIFNDSTTVQRLDGWVAEYDINDGSKSQTITIPARLSGMVAPSKYVIFADASLNLHSPFEYSSTEPESDDPFTVRAVRLVPPSDLIYQSSEVVTPSRTATNSCGDDGGLRHQSLKRRISTTTGAYLSTFCYYALALDTTLFMDPLYEYPLRTELQITEIVANADHCSPTDDPAYCRDFVKLYNPTNHDIDLAAFRLRDGYLGQSSSTSNTTMLQGNVGPGHYAVVPMDLTNQQSWLWLEDVYGIKRYDETVTVRPAVNTSHQGWAWAYDSTQGIWQWTDTTTPYDGPSIFTTDTSTPSPVTVGYAPCGPGKYRSTETHRCRNLATSTSLTACKSNQYRSSETNRCRNIATATSSLTPCKPGQYRSSETNRCRSLSVASTTLVPCAPNQERNPDTHRCRTKATNVPDAAFAIEPMKEAGSAFVGWWALGGIGLFAAGYAAWEWRWEMMAALRRVGNFFTSRT